MTERSGVETCGLVLASIILQSSVVLQLFLSSTENGCCSLSLSHRKIFETKIVNHRTVSRPCNFNNIMFSFEFCVGWLL